MGLPLLFVVEYVVPDALASNEYVVPSELTYTWYPTRYVSVDAVHDSTTVRVLPAQDTVRVIDPGVVGRVVSRMIDCDERDHGVPEDPLRARPEIVFVPSPPVSVHARVVAVDE